MFTEEMAPRAIHQTGLSKDAVEVEEYVRGFARRRPDVCVSTLRMANWIGPKTDSPITRYFSMPVIPTVFGYDARLQFLHEDDGVEAIHHATVNDLPGPSTWPVTGSSRSPRRSAASAGRPCGCLRSPRPVRRPPYGERGWRTSHRTRSPS